jgi:hypothetical protein
VLDDLRNAGFCQARIGIRERIGHGPLLVRPGRRECLESLGREMRRKVSPAQRRYPGSMYEDDRIVSPHRISAFPASGCRLADLAFTFALDRVALHLGLDQRTIHCRRLAAYLAGRRGRVRRTLPAGELMAADFGRENRDALQSIQLAYLRELASIHWRPLSQIYLCPACMLPLIQAWLPGL